LLTPASRPEPYTLPLHDALPIYAAEQLDAQEGLQSSHLPAHRALGQGQFLGGAGKALVARRRLEGHQRSGAGNLATHDKHSFRKDRKSTRLNSSHVKISYAVFCL